MTNNTSNHIEAVDPAAQFAFNTNAPATVPMLSTSVPTVPAPPLDTMVERLANLSATKVTTTVARGTRKTNKTMKQNKKKLDDFNAVKFELSTHNIVTFEEGIPVLSSKDKQPRCQPLMKRISKNSTPANCNPMTNNPIKRETNKKKPMTNRQNINMANQNIAADMADVSAELGSSYEAWFDEMIKTLGLVEGVDYFTVSSPEDSVGSNVSASTAGEMNPVSPISIQAVEATHPPLHSNQATTSLSILCELSSAPLCSALVPINPKRKNPIYNNPKIYEP